MRWTVKQPAANTVAAGQTATFRVPIGNRLHWLFLAFSGFGLGVSRIHEVRLKLNAHTVQRITGDRLNMLNMFRGLSDAEETGILALPLDRVGLLQRSAQEMTAINTNSRDERGNAVTSVTLEVDVSPNASAPVLDLYAEVSQQIPGGPGSIIWMLPETVTVNSEGEHEHPVTPVGGGKRSFLDATYFFTPNIERVQVQRDNKDLFDRRSALNDVIQADGMRVPQSGLYAYDPSERGFGGNMVQLAGSQDFRYTVQYESGGDHVLYNAFVGEAP